MTPDEIRAALREYESAYPGRVVVAYGDPQSRDRGRIVSMENVRTLLAEIDRLTALLPSAKVADFTREQLDRTIASAQRCDGMEFAQSLLRDLGNGWASKAPTYVHDAWLDSKWDSCAKGDEPGKTGLILALTRWRDSLPAEPGYPEPVPIVGEMREVASATIRWLSSERRDGPFRYEVYAEWRDADGVTRRDWFDGDEALSAALLAVWGAP